MTTAARIDAYAARSVLATLNREGELLRHTVDSSGLGQGHMPEDLMDHLAGSVVAAEARLKTLLAEPRDEDALERAFAKIMLRPAVRCLNTGFSQKALGGIWPAGSDTAICDTFK